MTNTEPPSAQPAKHDSGTSVGIDEKLYKADMELEQQYIDYGAAIQKQALAGLAALGLTVSWIVKTGESHDKIAVGDAILLVNAALLFLIAVGLSLAHRFFAAEGIYWHLNSCRPSNASTIDEDEETRDVNLKLAAALLGGVTGSFYLGAFVLVLFYVAHYLPDVATFAQESLATLATVVFWISVAVSILTALAIGKIATEILQKGVVRLTHEACQKREPKPKLVTEIERISAELAAIILPLSVQDLQKLKDILKNAVSSRQIRNIMEKAIDDCLDKK